MPKASKEKKGVTSFFMRVVLSIVLVAFLVAIVGYNLPRERDAFGNILPYNGGIVLPVEGYSVCSNYGMRLDPFTSAPSFHTGIDLCAPEGRRVVAAKDGNVVDIGNSSTSGNYVKIQHVDGTYTSYLHLSAISDSIFLESNVGAGTVLGLVGSTGRSTGPHLHFALQLANGSYSDPSSLLGIRNVGNGVGEDGSVSIWARFLSFVTSPFQSLLNRQ
jgi:murein DD-endopeptidase MepM/ murein hydrolase activator NlpD